MVKKHYQFVIIYVCVALLVFVSSMIWGIMSNKVPRPPGPVFTIIIKTLKPNGNSLSGVQIKVKNHRDTYYKVTDKSGKVIQRMRNLLPGDMVRVEVNKSGYELVSSSPGDIVIKEGQDKYEQTLVMQQIPPPPHEYTITVRTLDADSSRLGGVQVRIRRHPDLYYTEYTGNAGQVTQSIPKLLPDDTLHVEVSKNGYETLRRFPRYLVIQEGIEGYEQTFIMQNIQPEPTPNYVVEFIFQNETGMQIQGVSVYRNNNHIGESDQQGRFTDSFKTLGGSTMYRFRKQYYWGASWNASNYPAGQTHSQTMITMQKLLVSIRCVDTTGIYADNLENIEINRTNGTHLCWTDINGRCRDIELPTASMRLRFKKEDIFLPQDHEIIARRAEVTEVVLNPREGSLAITVMTSDGSVVPGVEVTMNGNGFYGSDTAADDGKACFTSHRIVPGKKYTVQVGSETQTTWVDKWDTERDFFLSD